MSFLNNQYSRSIFFTCFHLNGRVAKLKKKKMLSAIRISKNPGVYVFNSSMHNCMLFSSQLHIKYQRVAPGLPVPDLHP